MRLTPPSHSELDSIEIASRDEISALQVERLRTRIYRQIARQGKTRVRPPQIVIRDM